MQLLTQHFWTRWLKQYLPTLTRCVKWQSDCPSVKVAELILLRDDTVRRGLWPLGRIGNIYPGRDGIVHGVDVRTKAGVYRRPVVKIYPLEEQTFSEITERNSEYGE